MTMKSPNFKEIVDSTIFDKPPGRPSSIVGHDSIAIKVFQEGRKSSKDTANCRWCAARLEGHGPKSRGHVSTVPFFCSPQCAITWAVALNTYAQRNNLEGSLRAGIIDLGRPIVDIAMLEDD